MVLDYTNLKLCISVNAFVVNLCKINELGNKQLKVKILHNLKEFKINYIILFFPTIISAKYVPFSISIILKNNLQ